MDSKITKSRLSNFIAYEWIIVAAFMAVAIIFWELIFTATATRLTTGQSFSFYYDENMSYANGEAFRSVLDRQKAFSYDVLEVNSEALNSSYNVLSLRLSIYEGDLIFSDISASEEVEGYEKSSAKTYIDNYRVYDMDSLYGDAVKYLSSFLKEDGADATVYENLSEKKIEENFLNRMARDNRYKTAEQKAAGIKDECERIKALCLNVKDFKALLDLDDTLPEGEKLFFTYRKYEQIYLTSKSDRDKAYYGEYYAKETQKRYGLNIEKLQAAGKPSTADYLKLRDRADSKYIVALVFNFWEHQYDLQFETLGMITAITREFSDILDA